MCHQESQPTTCFTYTRHTITSRSEFELCNDSPNTTWLVISLSIFVLYGHISRTGSSEQIKQQSDYISYAIKIISYKVVLNMNKSFFLDISKWCYDPILAIPRRICFVNVNTRLIQSKLVCVSLFCISRFYCLLYVYITVVSRRGIVFSFCLCFRVQCEVSRQDYDFSITYSLFFHFVHTNLLKT